MKVRLNKEQIDAINKMIKDKDCFLQCHQCKVKKECNYVSKKYNLLQNKHFTYKDIPIHIIREVIGLD